MLQEKYSRVIIPRQTWRIRFPSYIGPIETTMALPPLCFMHTQHQSVGCKSEVMLQLQMVISCQSLMIDLYGVLVKLKISEETRSVYTRSYPTLIYLSKIPHKLCWNLIRTSIVRSRRLTARVMAYEIKYNSIYCVRK
jgi:hypothetical protein